MLVKEFKRCIKLDVNSFLDEKEVKPLEKAARLVDGYTFTHKISFVNRANPWKPFHPPSGLVLNPVLVSDLVILIRILPKPNLQVKTKVTILYLSLFAFITNNQIILFLIVLF